MTSDTKKAIVSFYGGVGSVTGSNFMLARTNSAEQNLRGREGDGTRILIDCGLIQGEKFAHDLNREPFAYDPVSVDYLLITHAHIDHVGRIPKLVRDGFKGKILSTPETLDLARLMLPDAFSVLRMETPEGAELLYDEQDIEEAFSLWETVPYHERKQVGEFEIFLKDSGHILGSAMVELSLRGSTSKSSERLNLSPRKIVFTGDLGSYPTPLLKQAEDITDATYLVMESVYGDRDHEGGEMRKKRLEEVIRDTIQRKGVLLIPCFSLEKTQVLLSEMDELFEDKRLFNIPVFLDSPLAIKVTDVYRQYADTLNPEAQKRLAGGDDLFSFKNLRLTMDARMSSEIERTPSPKIIIAGSGMSAGGRILDHERRYLGDHKNTILFIGYQAIGGLGRQIQERVKHLRIEQTDVTVRARIETITGYSSHMDSDHLLAFAEKDAGAAEKIFVVMGEPKASLFLAQRIQDYNGNETYVPVAGESVEIEL